MGVGLASTGQAPSSRPMTARNEIFVVAAARATSEATAAEIPAEPPRIVDAVVRCLLRLCREDGTRDGALVLGLS
jgi:hypothetical protein